MEIWPQMPVGVLNRSLGRALEWHSRGQRFDPAYLHQKTPQLVLRCFFIPTLVSFNLKNSAKFNASPDRSLSGLFAY